MFFTREELEGVPENVLSGLDRGTRELKGKLKVELAKTDIGLLMRFALPPETRKEILTRQIYKVETFAVCSCDGR